MRDERSGALPGRDQGRESEGPGRIGGRTIYDGRIVHLRVEQVRFPDGSTGEREIVRHPGAAAVLPVVGRLDEPDPEVLLIRQYRYATGGTICETPAGIPEEGESWEACARRELEEETGWRAGTLTKMTRVYTTPGFTDEVIHLFVASELEEGRTDRDEDEFMEVLRVPFSRALAMVREGEIEDAKSVSCVLFARSFVFPGGGPSAAPP